MCLEAADDCHALGLQACLSANGWPASASLGAMGVHVRRVLPGGSGVSTRSWPAGTSGGPVVLAVIAAKDIGCKENPRWRVIANEIIEAES